MRYSESRPISMIDLEPTSDLRFQTTNSWYQGDCAMIIKDKKGFKHQHVAG